MQDSYEDRMSATDELIDRVATQIQSAEPPPEQVADAAARVWDEISGKHNARRGMKLLRHGDAPPLDLDEDPIGNVVSLDTQRPRYNKLYLLAAAAMLVMAIGAAQLIVRTFWPAGPSATVAQVDGQLFRVSGASQLPITPGVEIHEGDVMRTGRDGGAVVRLEDGSLVELAPRTELSIDEGHGGTTLELARGNVIVEAAEQRDRHLYVSTDDCLVSVTGTIFSVNHGTKGSKVSVIEGEVRVDHSGEESVLHPGDQVTTHRLLASTTVSQEISWSQNVDAYLEILRQFNALEKDIAQKVARPPLRFSSRLLDLAPEDTAFFAAAPNMADTVSQTHRLLQERLAESQELSQWWASEAGGSFQDQIDEAIAALTELGSYLGEEVVLAGYFEPGQNEADQNAGIVGLAEVKDAAGLRSFAERKIAELAQEIGDADPDENLVFVDDPRTVTGEQGLYLWFHDDTLVITLEPARLRQAANLILDGADNPFVGSGFHTEINQRYADGAELLVAVDLEKVVQSHDREGNLFDDGNGEGRGESSGPSLADLGVDNARYLIGEQKKLGERTQHRLVASFTEARHGMASWLAEPAPMASLGFVSPKAKLVMSVVFEDPAKLLDDLLAMTGEAPKGLSNFEQSYGLSLREDFAATLGGEMTFALDGPLLPKPAWKAMVEVYDPARFQWTLEQALTEANTQLAAAGKPAMVLEESRMGAHTVYTLPSAITDVSYTFVDGFLLMAPNKALLDQAIRYRASGYSITESPRFVAMLPQDDRNNFSALIYQDLTSALGSIAEHIADGALSEEQQAAVEAIAANGEPGFAYAYGETDRIIIAASSDGDLLSSLLLRGFGLKDPAGMETLLGGLFESGLFEDF